MRIQITAKDVQCHHTQPSCQAPLSRASKACQDFAHDDLGRLLMCVILHSLIQCAHMEH